MMTVIENREDENTDGSIPLPGQESENGSGGFCAMEFGFPGRRSTFSGREALWETEILQQKIPVVSGERYEFQEPDIQAR